MDIRKDGDGPTSDAVHAPSVDWRQGLRNARRAKKRAKQIAKAQHRWPSGTPGSKGGQFAPGKNAGANAGWESDFKKPSGHAGGHGSGAKSFSSYADLFGINSTYPKNESPSWGKEQHAAPKPPPKGAKPHPQVDNLGKPVMVDYPTKPSDPATWTDPKKTATFVPGGDVPDSLNGVAFKPWASVPTSDDQWAAVEGQNPGLDHDVEFEALPHKSVGAGLIIKEPDGRIWLTRPTNGFGGYINTFPKGTVEHGLSMQASAIKEAYEETGLQVKITGILGDYERSTSKARFYTAVRVGGTPKDMGWESQAVRIAAPNDLGKLLNAPIDQKILKDLQWEGHVEKAAAAKPKGSYNASQPRWPAGTPLGGQWKGHDGSGVLQPPKVGSKANPAATKKAAALYAMAQKGDKAGLVKAASDLNAQVKAQAANGVSNYHSKELAKVAQYATELAAAQDAAPKVKAAAVTAGGIEKISAYKAVGAKPGGSNPGGMYVDASGQKWLAKGNAQFSNGVVNGATSDDRAKNEVLAAKLMEAVRPGSSVDMKLVDLEGQHGSNKTADKGRLGVLSKWNSDTTAFDAGNPAHRYAAIKDFALHAWLGNYDVLGMGYDNTRIDANGNAVNIDPGGAILFRAQGLPKKEFAADAPEWETMRNTTAEQKKVFGGMTQTGLQKSAEALGAISDDTIKALVEAHGPGNDAAKAKLADTLIARKAAILKKAGLTKDVEVAPGVVTLKPAPVPEPPKAAEAKVAVPPGGSGIVKPKFSDSLIGAKYKALADEAEALHAAGDLPGLYNMAAMHDWPTGTTNGKAFNAYHAALADDLDKKVMAGAPLTGGGQAWKADDEGVLQPALTGNAKQAIPKAELHAMFDEVVGVKGAAAKVMPDSPFGQLFAAAEAGDAMAALKVDIAGAEPNKLKDKIIQTMAAKYSGQTTTATTPAAALSQARAAKAPVSGNDMMGKVALTADEAEAAFNSGKNVHFKGNGGPSFTSLMEGDAPGWINTKKLVEAATAGDYETVSNAASGAKKNTAGYHISHALLAAMNEKGEMADLGIGPDDGIQMLTPATGPAAPLPAMPNFNSYFLPTSNSNAESHNAKVNKIMDAAGTGNAKAILAMNFGTNTYGKKQASLANDTLAALGSPHQVTVGQKAMSHPALTGKAKEAVQAEAVANPPPVKPGSKPKPTLADLTPDKLPPPPNMANYNGAGKPFSSKDWKNKSNQDAVNAIYAAALKGGMPAVDALMFPELDGNTGLPTGKMVPASQHPSKTVVGPYTTDIANALNDFLNPPKELRPFNVVSVNSVNEAAAKFMSAPMFKTVASAAKEHQLGFWIALGNIADPAAITPKETHHYTPAMKAEGKAAYKSYSPTTVNYISAVQASGQINRAYDQGKTMYGSTDLKKTAKAIYADATPLKAGSVLSRWQSTPEHMMKQLETAPLGLVFQSGGGMCTSMKEASANPFAGRNTLMRIVAAPGAKAIHSHGSGGFKSEEEITTLPGQRYVLLDRKIPSKGKIEITVLLLPPDPNWIT